MCLGGNEIFFANDAASAYIRAADALFIESDYDNDDSNKPIYFYTSGSEKMRIDGGGNVGIGGPGFPTEKLTVAGNISANGSLSASGAGYNYFNGRVGIGTTAPEEKLSVDGDIQLTNQKQITWADIGDCNTGRVRIVGNEDSDVISFHVDNSVTQAMYLNTTGIGIGTSAPAEKLTVAGNISARGGLSAQNIITIDPPWNDGTF